MVHNLKVSLGDLYNGATKKLSLSRNALCTKCKGKGSKSGAAGTCHGCCCAGMRTITRQIGLGMIQQMNTVCPECRRSGEMIINKDKCPSCKGNKVVQEKKVLEVHVQKGMQHGQQIVFQGEADEAEFPEPAALTPGQCRSIEKILPRRPGSQLSDMELDQCEETTMHDVNMEEEMRPSRRLNKAVDLWPASKKSLSFININF
ncbi:hypothetical protein ABZP36_032378 [Zizania latifolia]